MTVAAGVTGAGGVTPRIFAGIRFSRNASSNVRTVRPV
jgi:hypothetical protein